MSVLKKLLLAVLVALLLVVVSLNVWGYLTLGTIEPGEGQPRDPNANRVVMVFGATGIVGGGLLSAAMDCGHWQS